MPTSIDYSSSRDWRQLKKRREAYRQKLIAKGVVDGGTKMMALMCKFMCKFK